jgi:hypothetical protein
MDAPSLSYSLADQTFLGTKSLGILNVSIQLAHALANTHRFSRLTLLSNSTLGPHLPLNLPQRRIDSAHTTKIGRILWDQWRCYSAAADTGNDWLLLPKGFASAIRKPPLRLAAYIHDTLHAYYAERHPKAFSSAEQAYFEACLRGTLNHAEVLFTNSRFTRDQIAAFASRWNLKLPPTVVAGIGFSPGPATDPRSCPKMDALTVLVSPFPHKRSAQALSWVRRWQQTTRFKGAIHLVGSLPENSCDLIGPDWTLHPRLSPARFNQVVSASRALFYFSEYEGFGMPPVESILLGTCPVFSRIPALEEAMEDTGLSFSNDHFDSFLSAASAALETPEETLHQWRATLLQRHSWPRVALKIADALSHRS